MHDLANLASAFLQIYDTHRVAQPIEPPLESLSVGEAYRVQQMVIGERVSRGDKVVGYKVGCTSSAIRQQFGLTEPISGSVMMSGLHAGSSQLDFADFYQLAVEPEFVLTIARDLPGEVGDDKPIEDVIEYVSPGIELHNYHFWFGKPTMQELIASNGIHAGLVIGEQKFRRQEVDWQMEGVGLFRNARLAASGVAAEIMGGPLVSLRWLVNHLLRRGQMLRAGDIVIPGSPVKLVSVNRGDRITARFTHLGHVDAVFV